MALSAATLGPALASAAGSTDAPGLAAWNAIAAAIITWVTAAIVSAVGGTPLVAAGPVISGTGAIVPTGAPALAAAAGSTDAIGVASWVTIASTLATWLATGGINPSTLVAYTGVGSGPVTGTAVLAFTSAPPLATAAGSTDSVGIAAWAAIATAIRSHLQTASMVLPVMTNAGIGGPVAGTGTIS